MQIERRFTVSGHDVYDSFRFRVSTSEIRNQAGSSASRQDGIEVPDAWSQTAAGILARKYFRRRGVPAAVVTVEGAGVPSWMRRLMPAQRTEEHTSTLHATRRTTYGCMC